jgi:aspartate aminotransferase
VTPGIDFGAGAEGYLRFSYASPLEKIDEALDRIAAFCEDLKHQEPVH